ncbi:DoxX family protein [Mucilaginibacter sp. cycad4]|uniref:DoxX family protein n=1 Tax=Mucilaginibacter sp. cycad4 TaxID=3342096 RepID=UPI002AAB3121|nr:DoxX family protein [Mucilaginibacter gossypii]WPU99878.1 DoxX family protein [Mucilaginibacter gossypii]
MPLSTTLDQLHYQARGNKWMRLFAIFNRIVLAAGFIIAGTVKIIGERFASGLSANQPMGHYLEALHHTGYYYTFIGILQVAAAILLLIPRTRLLGALIYFPIILNICILAYALRFEGTRITTLMVLANLYLLGWDYDRLKYILPFKQDKKGSYPPQAEMRSNKFPFIFFGGVFATVVAVIVINQFVYDIRPGNSLIECNNGCAGNAKPEACKVFCDCVHNLGKPLDSCLAQYDKAPAEITRPPGAGNTNHSK